MTEIEQTLLTALAGLDNAVQTMPTANPGLDLLPLFTRIDELARQLPREADPGLLHFLQRKSYGKARARLEGRLTREALAGTDSCTFPFVASSLWLDLIGAQRRRCSKSTAQLATGNR